MHCFEVMHTLYGADDKKGDSLVISEEVDLDDMLYDEGIIFIAFSLLDRMPL